VIWDFLSQGGREHWGELSKGTVVQGRFKVVSEYIDCSQTHECGNWD
jgi:hypothetical protein